MSLFELGSLVAYFSQLGAILWGMEDESRQALRALLERGQVRE